MIKPRINMQKARKAYRTGRLGFLSILFLWPVLIAAQDSNLGNWLIYFGNVKLDQKWNLHHEVQYRNYDAIGDLEQLLLRTGLGYSFNDSKQNLLLGYGYILSENYVGDPDDKVSISEHRIYQQFISKQAIGKSGLTHRFRFEQRFVESDFLMRFRYFLSANFPLSNKGLVPKTAYLSAYNELFLNTEDKIFDRNRLYGGIGYRFSGNMKMELGYMNQFFRSSGRDQINIILFLNI
jgi:hypothetical protein